MTVTADTPAVAIRFTLNGEAVSALDGETILQAAQRHGVEIPHLCYTNGLRADGNCRACMVEIEGERVLAPSCCRQPDEGMTVHSDNERARRSQRMVLELLQSDMPETTYTRDNDLDSWSQKLALGKPRFAPRPAVAADLSHPAMAVNLDACIQCTRCIRACREVQVNDVIGYAARGSSSRIVFDMDDPMGDSTCVACGECVQACPTGALMPANDAGLQQPDKRVDSVCPYCGVGCQLTFNIKDNRILHVEGRDGPANHNRLCVKGRYGFDYVHHRQRLTRPLIRRDDAPKTLSPDIDPSDYSGIFREASWEEALQHAAGGLRDIRDRKGRKALAGFGSAKGSNEEAYLFQKLVRTGFRSNNVDHCTRLCHASSVVALLEMIGSGAVSNPVQDVAEADVIIVIGANPTENHPVAATFMKNAVKNGKTLIVIDPRRNNLARHAQYVLQFQPDTDVALLNGIMHAVIDQGLADKDFIADRTNGYEDLKKHLENFSPEAVAPLCGIDAGTLKEVARVYASANASMILWGMGISQHSHGTDNSRALISLALLCGQIGRPGTGLHPLRGQNNVQGASDVGLIPMVYPDYQRVDNEDARKRFEKLWGTELDPEPGLTVVEIMHAVLDEKIHGMYIMGENPAMSDPNLNHARKALASLDHLVVQDIFLTETAFYADVVLPASAFAEKTGTFTNTDRCVQLGRQAIDPPGEARQDLWIIQQLATRLGCDWHYEGPQQVFEEMRKAMPSIAGISWQRLQQQESVTYPCVTENDPGQPIIFREDFPTGDGRAQFVISPYRHAQETPDPEYPFVLITGRQLEHWHTGAMTRRATVLNELEPSPVASLHPDTLRELGAEAGDPITLSSRRGNVEVTARADDAVQPAQVFLPFCYHEAAANLLTNEALDPDAKIPEFKYCAIRVSTL
ncbi:MAG: formate dehydrogenase subunit alpha [Gammaproteobacteria bacterium]|nr:formate dehydrogenase subunit alpha [Gammaproteobacteria bacterium]MDH3933623.1 formate dehydrogenase subunit alpha [Gammaproteobacteria bacterium]